MIDLKSQLLDRYLRLTSARDESFDKAKQLFDEQDYEGCVNELNRIDLSVTNEEIVTLLKRADRNNERVEALYSEIHQRIKTKQIDGLLLKVNELVALKSDDKHILNLQEQLVERESAQESELANKQELAINCIEECIIRLDYIEAMEEIVSAKENGLITKEKQKDLLQRCKQGLEVISKSNRISLQSIVSEPRVFLFLIIFVFSLGVYFSVRDNVNVNLFEIAIEIAIIGIISFCGCLCLD